jgi:2-methylaconitate cis-trans-isomerase PrpF
MRGGTSKALFLHENHLPKDPKVKDRVILAAYGSPDSNRRQIDGIGGGVSTTSKVAIISPSKDPDYDVVYNFGQVSIDKPIVDYKGNCGNISTAVGPFAVDEGLVVAEEPITQVRIYQKNTNKLIIADVPVKEGRFDEEGDYAIAGVPVTGSKITLHFVDPGGAMTGKLLPTGNAKDRMDIPDIGEIAVTIIDAANPVVIVNARDIGLNGTEITEIDNSEAIRERLETIRGRAAVMIGLCASPEEASQRSQAVPKAAFVASPKSYQALTGEIVQEERIDLVARIMSMGTLHKSFAVSGAISVAGTAKIEGSVVHEFMDQDTFARKEIILGHPGGVIEVGADMEKHGNTYIYKEALLGRTARRLMEGYVCVPEKFFH